jgi:hypothetical protein
VLGKAILILQQQGIVSNRLLAFPRVGQCRRHLRDVGKMRLVACGYVGIDGRRPHANSLLLETLDEGEDDNLDASLDEIHEGSRLKRYRGMESAQSSPLSSDSLEGFSECTC